MKKQPNTSHNQTYTNEGSINQLPSSVIRSVSFQKLREGSLSSRNSALNSNQSSIAKDQTKNKTKTNELFQKMLNNKLLANQNTTGNKMSSFKNKIDIAANKQPYPFQNSHKNKENAKNNKNIVHNMSRKEQQQLKECTFHPRTNNHHLQPRTVNQFVEHQMQFQKYKEDRIEKMRQLIKQKRDQQNTFQPNNNINKLKPQNQTIKLSKNNVHQRLFNEAKQRRVQQIEATCKQIYENNIETKTRHHHTKQNSNYTQSQSSKQQQSNDLLMPKLQTTHQLFLQSKMNGQTMQKLLSQKQQQVPSNCQSVNKSLFHRESYAEYMQKLNKKNSQKQIKKQGISLSSHTSKPKRNGSITTINKKLQSVETNPIQVTKKKNQILVIKKIFKQITLALENINIEKKNCRLAYLDMCTILKQLKFIHKNAIQLDQLDQISGFSSNLEARKLLAELWELLQGQINGTIDLISLIKIIYAVLGCHNVKSIQEFLNQQLNSCKSQNNSFLNQYSTHQNLIITEQDSKGLKNKFETFYNNRLLLSELKQGTGPQYSFHPRLSKNTEQMAEKYRMKVINDSQKYLDQNMFEYKVPQNGKITHIDLLMLDQKRRQLKIQAMRLQKERQIQDEENVILNKNTESRNRSLRTSIRESEQNDLSARTKISTTSKFQQLYENSRSTSRRDRTQDEIQMQKWAKDLTFKPEIHKFRCDRHQGVQMVQDFDKAVFRMQQGKKVTTNKFSKPITSDPSLAQSKNTVSDKPILYLNVSMEGNQNVKVPVFYGDTLRSITQKVYIMLDMDNNEQAISKQELQLLLKGQVQPALKSIH